MLIIRTLIGPLSEISGRQLPLFLGFCIWLLLQIPIGFVNNLPALLTFRMLGGCFGAAPVALVSAMYADFWEPAERGTATAVYSAAVVSIIRATISVLLCLIALMNKLVYWPDSGTNIWKLGHRESSGMALDRLDHHNIWCHCRYTGIYHDPRNLCAHSAASSQQKSGSL